MNTFLSLFACIVVVRANYPADWSCHPLNKAEATDADCLNSASLSGDTWSIKTTKAAGGINKFCVVTLSGEDVSIGKDYYVQATFSPGPTSPAMGPFAGLTFNQDEAVNAQYVMMRLKFATNNQIEIGRLDKGNKDPQEAHVSDNIGNAFIKGGNPTLGILVQDGEEKVYINNVLEEDISDYQPYYTKPGAVGIGLQNVLGWDLTVTGAQVCTPVTCSDDEGNVYSGGDSWVDDDGKTCTCTAAGIQCVCGDASKSCPGGTQKWVDPETCEAKCIRDPAYCTSSGDPHYWTFDKQYYDFHGMCTYQAASCGDFVVNFKNVDFYNSAPRYTKRLELEFKGQVFAIANNYAATVDGVGVQVPYVKTYTNGDRVEIVNNGQLEIRLYNKGRNPSVRLRANNAGSYVNAEMWLHGSCADVTEGLCGNWNGNGGDDTPGGPNAHGESFKKYDENCPAPPEPEDFCRDNGLSEDADAICSVLKDAPFSSCHGVSPVGDATTGVYRNCMQDVCNCFLDQSCACSQLENYAQGCINAGVDLSQWRKDVAFCPYDCPDGQVYNPAGATPVPTCLDKDPEQTGTVRGCFCPEGQYLQDNVCIDGSQCQCLHEGIFYDNGAEIVKEGECKKCRCEDAGEMICEDMVCPELSCDDDEIVAYKDDQCCPYCEDEWVEALNPDNQLKKGQKVVLTCAIHAEGVKKKNIVWYKGEKKITKGLSRNKLRLTITDADADDSGVYRCTAMKDGAVGEDSFTVDVVMPAICEHEDGTTWEEGEVYNPQATEACTCDAHGVHTCKCIDDGEECEDPTPVTWFNDNCIKTCVPEEGLCSAAADPYYVSFDGSKYSFKGDCTYKFFGCGDVAMFADHQKDEASTKTKYIDVVFHADTFRLEGNTVTINGEAVVVPLHKTYEDGSILTMTDVGRYTLSIVQDGKDPLVELIWDKVSSYNIKVHGSCKGFTTGMCGVWNDNVEDDLTMPDGEIAESVEEFGTAWAIDDETDCPKPDPPPDMCEIFAMMGMDIDKEAYENHVKKVLGAGSLGKCSKVIDNSNFVDNIVQEICGCGGDLTCSCTPIEQFAETCAEEGIDTSNWQLENQFTECAAECPEGTVFKAKGPKPAPTCRQPNGGKKSQKGCFCPEGQVLENEKCINTADCQCEYAGQRYDVGEKWDKDAECQTCTCTGAAVEECGEMECKTKCDDDEIEVHVEDHCCPVCMSDWVTPVNPNAEGTMNKPLALTCKVEGVTVTADNVKWYKYNPGNENIGMISKHYTVSESGLVLTIKQMTAAREGQYKCVVEKDGKTSEGEFVVTLPIKHEDLIAPKAENVAFIEGGTLNLEVTKLGGKITEIWWECKGVRMSKTMDRVSIKNNKAFNRLVIKPATLEDQGSCTCYAHGVGTEDSQEITIGGNENTVTITPVQESVECTERKKGCFVEFTIERAAGKALAKETQICKVAEDGSLESCVQARYRAKTGVFFLGMGYKTPLSAAGDYMCVYTKNGEETKGGPVTVSVTPR